MTPETFAAPGPTAADRPSIPDIVDEHVEEHGFLALQRRKLMFSSEVPARRVAELDERIAAHWDGLVVNRPAAVTRSEDGLAADDPWERATCARAWFALGRPDEELLLARWAEAPPEHLPSWREALRGLESEDLERLARLGSRSGLAGIGPAAVTDALGWHGRLDPVRARRLAGDPDPLVRLAVARQAHLAPGPDGEELARGLLDDPDDRVRRRALWSELLRDPERGLDRARRVAVTTKPDPFALRAIGLMGTPDDHELLVRAAATEAGRPAVFHAFADLGTTEAVESLVRLLALPDVLLALEATEALEAAVGPIAREDPAAPATVSEARTRVEALAPVLDRPGARVLTGHRWPWRGEAGEEPGASAWRSAVSGRHPDPVLRREVPDGFFGGLPVTDARPGE